MNKKRSKNEPFKVIIKREGEEPIELGFAHLEIKQEHGMITKEQSIESSGMGYTVITGYTNCFPGNPIDFKVESFKISTKGRKAPK